MEIFLKQKSWPTISSRHFKGFFLFLFFFHIFFTIILFSNKFWKKFDSAALSLHKEFIKASQKLTRHFTREILKYIGEKNTFNQTTFNHISDIWENVYKERCQRINGIFQLMTCYFVFVLNVQEIIFLLIQSLKGLPTN